MNGSLTRSLGILLLLLPAYLAGCSSSDDGEYRAYAPTDSQFESTLPADAGTADIQPGEQSRTSSTETDQTTDPFIADTGNDVSRGPNDDGTVNDAAAGATDSTTSDPTAPSPLENTALTPEQQAEILAIASAAPSTVAPSEPREVQLLVPEKTFRVEGPQQALRITYDDLDLLKVLNMDPVTIDAPTRFPSWLRDLEGQHVRLRGYMRPGVVSEDLPMFVLARDTKACCFGPNTKAYDIIPVMLQEGTTTDYIHLRPFDIVGVFHINVEPDLDDPNKVQFIYYIDDAVLIEK